MPADHDNLSLDRQQRLAELRRQLGGMGVEVGLAGAGVGHAGVGHRSPVPMVPIARAACASRHSGMITLGGVDDLAQMGLALGRLHEWWAPPAPHGSHAPHGLHGPHARPPRVVLVQLAAAWWRRCGMDAGAGGAQGPPLATAHASLVSGRSSLVTALGMVVWIGEAVWPHPAAVYQVEPGLAAASVYVRAASVADRVWAADLCARAGGCVIVDMQGMDMAATRRLQLAGQGRGGDETGTGWGNRWGTGPRCPQEAQVSDQDECVHGLESRATRDRQRTTHEAEGATRSGDRRQYAPLGERGYPLPAARQDARRTAASPTAATSTPPTPPTTPTTPTPPTSLILGTRPAEERGALSAAMTRWSVRPVLARGLHEDGGGASGGGGRGCSAWALTLEAAKGQGRQRGRTWIMEVQHASGVVRVVDAHGYGHGEASVAGAAGPSPSGPPAAGSAPTIDDHDRGAA